MKLRRLFFTFLISLAAFQFCFSQEKPKAVLFTEVENPNCEILLATADAFFNELNNDPNSQGYAVIYGKKNDLREKLTYELWLNGAMIFRKFDDSRIIKIRGADAENLKIEFWKVPTGAEKPMFNELKWNFVFPAKTKPFVFHDEYEQICYSGSFEKAFAEYLNANPDARGHIVIYETSNKKYLKQKKEAQKLLSEIPQNRLRFFQVKSDSSNVEFWLVPKKKK